MKLRYKILLPIAGILLLAPTAAVYYVATTESGLQAVVSRLGKMGSITITAGTVKGTLVDGISVDSLRIETRNADVQIDHAAGRIDLLPLLLMQRINTPKVTAEHVTVTMKPTPDRPFKTPFFLPSMMRVDADAVQVPDVDIIPLRGKPVKLRNVEGRATVLPRTIIVQSSQLDYEIQHIVATGKVFAAKPIGLQGEMEISWSMEGQPDWLILTKFDGNLDRLPLTGRIEKPFHADLKGAATTLNKGWNIGVHAKVIDLDIAAFGGGKALGIISGELDATATSSGFAAKGLLTPPGLKAGAMGVDFHGSYANKVLTIRDTTVTHAPSGARATTQGTVTVIKGGPELALSGDWTRFRWPLADAMPAFSSPRGHYTLTGVKPWGVTLSGDVVAADLPVMPANLRGVLSGDSLRIDEANVQVFNGNAKFSGDTHWQPAETWNIAGHMTGMDPSGIRPDLPGQVNFDFVAAGTPYGSTGSLDLTLQKLSGKLRNQNISGRGQFTRAANSMDWQFRGVDMSLGRTRLQLDGGFGAQNDLTFTVNADDLSLFDSDARGRVNATGRYAGTRETAQLVFKGQGSKFEWQGYKLDALNADVDIDLRTDGHARGRIDISKLELGARTVDKASLQLTGTGEQQKLALTAEAAPLRTALTAQGTIRDGLWQGTLQSLDIDDARNLKLRLEAPATLAANLQRIELGQACLKGEPERLCMAGKRQPDGIWNATLTADSLPLRTLTTGLTKDTDFDGTINLQAELTGSNAELPVGTARGELKDARLRHRLANGQEEPMALGTGTITANATSTGFNMQVGLDAGKSGNIKAELNGDRIAGEWQGFPIRGSLDASSDAALALLDIYFGGVDKATGRIITKVNIGGTLGQPTLQGQLQLRDASIDIYQTNTLLRELTLDASFNADSLDITGQSRLGPGRAKFNGKLAWRDNEPYGNLHVESVDGESLRVVDVPEARIDVSPDLDFKITGHRIDATGEVDIPNARLEPADLTTAVLASSDERLVGAPVVDPSQRWTVVSRIGLKLGSQVHLNSMGLNANLGGSLVVSRDESQITRGQGELNIVDGKFAALGRLLDIERGRLRFNNGPLNDPSVDIRAQKIFTATERGELTNGIQREITAGVNVRGTLRAPRMTLFSEPALSQSQIAAVIVGGSLESVQDSTRPGAARNDLLGQVGAIAGQQFGSRVGLDDVGLESNLDNDTSLVLGKYLSDRIYVSYGISLAEAINTLKVRFTLTKRWTVKTEAGKARSADIVYTIQK